MGVAVAGVLVVVAVVVAFVVVGGGDDAEAGDGGRTGGPSTPSETAAEAEALPQRYVGEWEGDITIDPGVSGGSMTIVLEAGRVGEQLGVASNSDVLGLFTCVDLLTLTEVTGERLVFDAHIDSERSNETACYQGDFHYTLEPRGDNALHFSTDSPGSLTSGVLDRQT